MNIIDFDAARVRILRLQEYSIDFSPSATYLERLRVRLPAADLAELARTVLEESK